MMMKRQIINTSAAPQAIGTYSQGVVVGSLLFVSGQIPLDPQTMALVSDDFAAQALQAFTNLRAVVEAAGAELHQIAKLTIYVTDLAKFSIVNAVMAEFFSAPYPARAVVEVSRLPKEADIEMDAIVHLSAD